MLKIIFEEHDRYGVTARAEVKIAQVHAPAFRSAIEEIRNEVGGRLEGAHSFAKEDALTRASIALGRFAEGLNQLVTEGDEDYA